MNKAQSILHRIAHLLRINRCSPSIIPTLDGDWFEVGIRCVGCGQFKQQYDWNSYTNERRNYASAQH
jgi:hypothetical protein